MAGRREAGEGRGEGGGGGREGSGRGGRRGKGHKVSIPQMGLDKRDLDSLLSESDWR